MSLMYDNECQNGAQCLDPLANYTCDCLAVDQGISAKSTLTSVSTICASMANVWTVWPITLANVKPDGPDGCKFRLLKMFENQIF